MPVRAAPPLLAAVLAAVLGGCGEPRGDALGTVPEPVSTAPPAIPEGAVAIAEVSLTEYRISAPVPRVAQAGLVAFEATDDGLEPHVLAVDGPSGVVMTPVLRPGERATIALRLPRGNYKWYCPLADHEQRGMRGRVRVAE